MTAIFCCATWQCALLRPCEAILISRHWGITTIVGAIWSAGNLVLVLIGIYIMLHSRVPIGCDTSLFVIWDECFVLINTTWYGLWPMTFSAGCNPHHHQLWPESPLSSYNVCTHTNSHNTHTHHTHAACVLTTCLLNPMKSQASWWPIIYIFLQPLHTWLHPFLSATRFFSNPLPPLSAGEIGNYIPHTCANGYIKELQILPAVVSWRAWTERGWEWGQSCVSGLLRCLHFILLNWYTTSG